MSVDPIPEGDERIAHEVIGAAIEVHRLLGPGFLERIYERAMTYELGLRGLAVQPQGEILVPYKGILIPGQQIDLLIGERVIVELKAVDKLHPIHEAQLLSYLKATNLRLGLLLNFNVTLMKDGIKRLSGDTTCTRVFSLFPLSSSRAPWASAGRLASGLTRIALSGKSSCRRAPIRWGSTSCPMAECCGSSVAAISGCSCRPPARS